jgi:uncharacterized membrane protein
MSKKNKSHKNKDTSAHKRVAKKAAAIPIEAKNNKSRKMTSEDKRAAKKAIVLGTEKKSRLPLVSLLGALCLLIAGAAFLMTRKGQETSAVADIVSPDVSATSVAYPVELFDDGQARFFRYAADDTVTIKYFVLKSSDGVVRAAFDACDVCWRAGKGYYQSGDVMVCRNCGRTFASVLVNEVKGGCNPAPLRRKVEDGKVVIQLEDVLAGKQYFDFSRRS